MTMNSSGPISLGGCTSGQSISYELSLSGTAQISLNCTNVRTLAGVASGAIIMPTNFYGKSNFPGNYYFSYIYNTNGSSAQGVYPIAPVGGALDSNCNFIGFGLGSCQYTCYSYNFSAINVFSNTGSNSYSKNFASPSGGTGQALSNQNVAIDSSNNIYITYNQNNGSIGVSKFNSSLVHQWTNIYNSGSFVQNPGGITVDSSGNVYIGGTSRYINPAGNFLWSLTSSGSNRFYVLYGVGSTMNGNSQGYGAPSLDGSGNVWQIAGQGSAGAATSYLSSYTTSGTLNSIGVISNGSGTNVNLNRVSAVSSSSVYVFGYVIVSGVQTCVLANMSSTSSINWQRSITPTGVFSAPVPMTSDSSGNAYFLILLNPTSGVTSYRTFALYKFNSSGSVVWTRYIYTASQLVMSNNNNITLNVTTSSIVISLYVGDRNFNSTYYSGTLPFYSTGILRLPTDGTGVGSYLTKGGYPIFYSTVLPFGSLSVSSATNLTVSSYTPFTTSTASISVTSSTILYNNSSTSTTASNLSTPLSSGYGSQTYANPGTYSWVAPSGVTSVSVVAIGGGGGGCGGYGGGGGGGLGYYNNYSVTPGNSYTVVVGTKGAGQCNTNRAGGQSYFVSTGVVYGNGGTSTTVSTNAGYGGTGGGLGGSGGRCSVGSGGGAGGYSGTGGGSYTSAGQAGSGGGGGAGGAPTGVYGAGGGGGVNIFGQGCSGGSQSAPCGGKPGSSGVYGGRGLYGCCCGPYAIGGYGGIFGGGGGGYNDGNCGGSGVVRIIWPGSSRTFPSTNVGNV